MFKSHLGLCVVSMFALLCFGCGHTQTCEVGLISFGNLEGKAIPNNPNGPVLEGSSAAKIGSTPHYYLSDAVRDALKNSEYNTMVDVEVTTKTGLFVPSNKISVKGMALNSSQLENLGGDK